MTRKYRVLVVDDEKHVRQLISKVLDKAGYDVITAENGEMAIGMLQDQSVDVIISDIKMPKMDGIELLHRIREQDMDVGFILITAFATTETAIDAIRNGAQDYVTKPFDIDEILNAVEKIVMSIGDDSHCSVGADDEGTVVISKSPRMKDVYQLSKRVAASDATVLVLGETGTGKEVISTVIHQYSKRADQPMIKVNCGAIPDSLLESELFGYEKGAFTGAASSKPGRFEIADHGTIFLDEIGDISPQLQVKLLRVLQEKTFERLGGIHSVKVDVRVIAATNRDLKKAVANGMFREDLYYRLNVVPIELPPLRERKEDIELLTDNFLRSSAQISGGIVKKLEPDVMDYLMKYDWPGNIRELENIIERCVVIAEGNTIDKDCLPIEILEYTPDKNSKTVPGSNADDTGFLLNSAVNNKEREVIVKALREHGGNKTQTALALGISRRSLHRKIQKYEIAEL